VAVLDYLMTHPDEVISRMSNQVMVSVRDLSKVGSILDGAIEAGANQVYSVTSTVSDESTWKSEARAKAMADVIARAHESAGLAEVELDEVRSVSEPMWGVPTAMMGVKVGGGMGGDGIAPGELELRTQIQVTFAIQ